MNWQFVPNYAVQRHPQHLDHPQDAQDVGSLLHGDALLHRDVPDQRDVGDVAVEAEGDSNCKH